VDITIVNSSSHGLNGTAEVVVMGEKYSFWFDEKNLKGKGTLSNMINEWLSGELDRKIRIRRQL
jgi:hypothetical protein